METNTTPLFDPVTHALLRDPTPEEQALADKKAELIKTYRNLDLPQKERDAAKATLESLVEGTATKEVWDGIIAGKKVVEEVPVEPPAPEAAEQGIPLKHMLVFDPKHSRNPPKGKVKALLVTEKEGKNYFVAVNIFSGETKIPNYDTVQFGEVVGGPAELQDHEWKDLD